MGIAWNLDWSRHGMLFLICTALRFGCTSPRAERCGRRQRLQINKRYFQDDTVCKPPYCSTSRTQSSWSSVRFETWSFSSGLTSCACACACIAAVARVLTAVRASRRVYRTSLHSTIIDRIICNGGSNCCRKLCDCCASSLDLFPSAMRHASTTPLTLSDTPTARARTMAKVQGLLFGRSRGIRDARVSTATSGGMLQTARGCFGVREGGEGDGA